MTGDHRAQFVDRIPQYVSHKVVRAAVIVEILSEVSCIIRFDGEEATVCEPDFARRRTLEDATRGDFLVFYRDGYVSRAPARDFVGDDPEYTRKK